MLKIALLLVKNVFCDVKKVISELVSQITAKPTALRSATSLKETLAQMFSCEFVKSLRTPFFTEHLGATASDVKIVIKEIKQYLL